MAWALSPPSCDKTTRPLYLTLASIAMRSASICTRFLRGTIKIQPNFASPRKKASRYGCVTVENVEIETIKQREDGLFEASGDGRTWTAKKVVLATGVEDVFPDIPGYADCWGTGM